MRIFGKGFNFSQDGPGNRLVYHLSGCNMHCPWCSNPEGMDAKAGNDYSVQEIVAECISAKAMFFSGGGVTFTGGESTLQHYELLEVLKRLKNEGIHTAIETNGTSGRLQELIPYVDYLIMDYKHFDAGVLREFTGVGNEVINQNFSRNCANGIAQHIRIPLINGFNSNDPMGFVNYFTQYDTSKTVFEFLPYHEYGKDKWKSPYQIQNGYISAETLQQFMKVFTEHSLQLITT